MIYIQVPSSGDIQNQINKVIGNINLAIGRAVPQSAKGIAERVMTEQKKVMNILKGTQNKTGRPNKSPHTKFVDTIEVMKFSDSPSMSRYDVVVTAPHKYWVEQGSNAKVGLPWSHPSGKKPRDYSKSVFKGYHVLEMGLQSVVSQGLHLQITKKFINDELKKIKGFTGG